MYEKYWLDLVQLTALEALGFMIPRDKFTVKGLILDQSPILCLPTLVPPVTCREYWVDLPILANPFQI